MTFSQDRGSGRLAQWEPQPLPVAIASPQPSQLTPADFMQGLAGLQQAMQQNTAAMAEFQRQQAAALEIYRQPPAPVQYQPAPMLQQWSPPPQPYPQSWQAPQPWQAPAPPQLHATISPVINIDSRSNSHSSQDNSGGGWFAILLGLFFLVPISAALVGGGR